MSDNPDEIFLTVEEAARFLRMAKGTLDNHRSKKTGPECRYHGGRVVYRLGDLLRWSEQRAARRKSAKTPPDSTGDNGLRTPDADMAEGIRTQPALEWQLQHSNWPLRVDQRDSGKGPTGSRPAA